MPPRRGRPVVDTVGFGDVTPTGAGPVRTRRRRERSHSERYRTRRRHRRCHAHHPGEARGRPGQLASGRSSRLRPHLVDRPHRGRSGHHRRCHRGMRDRGGRAEHQRHPQCLGVGRASPERAGHHRRSAVRFFPTGHAVRRCRGQGRPLRPGGGLRGRVDEPGAAGLQRPWRNGPVSAVLPRSHRRPPMGPVPGGPGPGRPVGRESRGDGPATPWRVTAGRQPPGMRAASPPKRFRCP